MTLKTTVLIQPREAAHRGVYKSTLHLYLWYPGRHSIYGLLFLKQQLGVVIKLFNYNELDFLQAVMPVVLANVPDEPASETSYLFTDSWYAWQDSDLRPVAPKARIRNEDTSTRPDAT
jgi:hypothetical protein